MTPKLVSETEAAALIGISLVDFRHFVAANYLPRPVQSDPPMYDLDALRDCLPEQPEPTPPACPVRRPRTISA